MPELPEVETVRLDLIKHLIGAQIDVIKIIDLKNITPSAIFLLDFLPGQEVSSVRRKGKLLIIDLKNSDYHLLFHLKMTGQLIFTNKKIKIAGGHSLDEGSSYKAVGGELPNKHTRAYFLFTNGARLFFNDLRKFAYIKLVNRDELTEILLNNYGPEPLTPEFNLPYFKSILKNRKRVIKALILDQKLIAGLGNIYADESLFLAGIKPWKEGKALKSIEVEKLIVAINELIAEAIKYRGTTFRNYVDAEGKKGNFTTFLKVYGREGQACFNCGAKILKIKLVGRGTHYCANCQK